MYAKRIQLTNYGPIDKLDIELPFDGETPKPVVLVGQNGSGKSIVLSHVVNGLLNAKDTVYPATPEVQPGRVYKLKSNYYIKSGSHFSFARVDFEDGWFVSEITTLRPKREYPEVPPGIPGTPAEAMWQELDPNSRDHADSNWFVDNAAFNRLEQAFAANCVLYFPFNRFEEPAWLNKDNLTNPVGYDDRKRMVAHTQRVAIATSPLHDNRNWVYDVLYDRRVPETRSVRVPLPSPDGADPWYLEAERAETRDHDEAVLRTVLQIVRRVLRDDSKASFRVSRRGNRYIALHGDHGVIVPNLFQLSSGETSLLNLFLCILRDFESAGSRFSGADDIRGIVVVDEVDVHLHAVHQFEVLPDLIRLFPNVQFLMTTHSPLFVLGMQRVFGEDGFGLYRLPDGLRISPEEFSEFGDAYRTLTSTHRFVDDIRRAVEKAQKPVLLTEGETDRRYVERASELLGFQALLARFEVRDGGGSGNLAKIWKYPMTDLIPQKVLLLFDCDTNRPDGVRGNLFQRTIPHHPENPVTKGIENLFDRATLERAARHSPSYVDVEREHKAIERGVETVIPEKWVINADEKANLCGWLCQDGDQADFRHFRAVFDLIAEVVGLTPSEAAALCDSEGTS